MYLLGLVSPGKGDACKNDSVDTPEVLLWRRIDVIGPDGTEVLGDWTYMRFRQRAVGVVLRRVRHDESTDLLSGRSGVAWVGGALG